MCLAVTDIILPMWVHTECMVSVRVALAVIVGELYFWRVAQTGNYFGGYLTQWNYAGHTMSEAKKIWEIVVTTEQQEMIRGIFTFLGWDIEEIGEKTYVQETLALLSLCTNFRPAGGGPGIVTTAAVMMTTKVMIVMVVGINWMLISVHIVSCNHV